MVFLILNGMAKTKLTVLAFLYCGEFVKNSNDQDTVILHIAIILGMFLHLSVILPQGEGVSAPVHAGIHSQADIPRADTSQAEPPDRQTPSVKTPPHPQAEIPQSDTPCG